MDYIKDKTACINLIGELFNSCGSPKEVANRVDDVIFNYFDYLCRNNECVGDYKGNLIYTLREIRDLFSKLEMT
jgi:hypothetical protein